MWPLEDRPARLSKNEWFFLFRNRRQRAFDELTCNVFIRTYWLSSCVRYFELLWIVLNSSGLWPVRCVQYQINRFTRLYRHNLQFIVRLSQPNAQIDLINSNCINLQLGIRIDFSIHRICHQSKLCRIIDGWEKRVYSLVFDNSPTFLEPKHAVFIEINWNVKLANFVNQPEQK